MAFSLFGKKAGDPKSTAARPGAALPSSKTPPTRRVGGVADYFSGQDAGPGRFVSHGARAKQYGESESSNSSYAYGSEVSANSVEDVVNRSILPGEPGATRPSAVRSQFGAGPMTEAAFTQVPSQLDMSAMPGGRRAQLSGRDMPKAIEDCALTFANGQTSEALKRIEGAIGDEDLGQWGLQAWLMRFDLYEQLGLKAAFENETMAFAEHFERSPPVWNARAKAAEDGRDTNIPTVNITGQLSSGSAAPLSALRKTVDRYQGVRLDFSRLISADKEGCRFLLVTIQSLKRAGKRVLLGADDILLRYVKPHIVAGNRSSDATTWLLYLEILQLRDEPEEFERVAIEYATTFEVSPPSWQREAKTIVAQNAEPTLDDRFYLEGDVLSPASALAAELENFAWPRSLVVLDCSRTNRIDFVACSELANLLAKLQGEGRSIEIRSPNEMISALFVLMGVNEVARIVPRRN